MTGNRRRSLDEITAEVVTCRRCPRLVAWREEVAVSKRAAYRDEAYWGRPVPGFGDVGARLLVVGLAPAAHGANRTGRMFTGDRSGDWLFRAMHRAGFASRAESHHVGDDLSLTDAWVTAAVRCAPPANKPTAEERRTCGGWLDLEILALESLRVIVCLGSIAYQATWQALRRVGVDLPKPRPAFGHARHVPLDGLTLITSYHPSQQNTFTGRLTEPMLDRVFASSAGILGDST